MWHEHVQFGEYYYHHAKFETLASGLVSEKEIEIMAFAVSRQVYEKYCWFILSMLVTIIQSLGLIKYNVGENINFICIMSSGAAVPLKSFQFHHKTAMTR